MSPNDDPTTAAIEDQISDRERLRAELDQCVAKSADAAVWAFEAGYDQAVLEIRDHFAKAGDHGIVHMIETRWKVSFGRGGKIS